MRNLFKKCSSCDGIKPLESFSLRGGGRTDRQSKCRSCNKEYLRKYFKKNKAKIIEQRRKYIRSNPLIELTCLYRDKTRKAFLYRNLTSGGFTERLLGADWRTIESYFERMFTDEMSWDEPDTWVVDHIKPLSKAKTLEELRRRCHYTNLQPLHPKVNRAKSNKTEKQWEDYKKGRDYQKLINQIKAC